MGIAVSSLAIGSRKGNNEGAMPYTVIWLQGKVQTNKQPSIRPFLGLYYSACILEATRTANVTGPCSDSICLRVCKSR